MPSLISLRRTDREKREDADLSPRPEESRDYDWNLELHLTHKDLQKLGFARDGIESGTKVGIVATGTVSESKAALVNDQQQRTLTLQLQEMSLTPIKPQVSEAELIYGGKVAQS